MRHVDAAIMGDEAPLFRRLGSLQRYVADGLREPEPERAVVERLARFMDASAAVLEPDGSVSVAVGKAPFAALRLSGHAVVEVEADGWCAVAAPLAAEEAHGWLVLASPRAHFVGTFTKRAVEATAPLLVAMDQLKEVARAQELGERAALLDEALQGGDPGSLAIRAAVFGIDFTAPVRVVIGAPDLDGPHLRSGDVALVQGDVTGGAQGRAIESMADVPVSLRDAQLAAARGVASFEDLDLATLLLTDADPERLAPRVERIVAVLEEHPPLHEALVAYFAHDLDVPAAAAEVAPASELVPLPALTARGTARLLAETARHDRRAAHRAFGGCKNARRPLLTSHYVPERTQRGPFAACSTPSSSPSTSPSCSAPRTGASGGPAPLTTTSWRGEGSARPCSSGR